MIQQLVNTKDKLATGIAILFHSVGLIGILFLNQTYFTALTPFNIILSFALLIYTQTKKNKWFWLFMLSCFVLGFLAEYVGVNTAALFGEYEYGKVLGVKIVNVPLIISINWFVIIYCCGISIYTMLHKLTEKLAAETGVTKPTTVKIISVIVDGATLAVFFDWIMEPVATKLNFWKWANDEIPFYNYLCWFLVSMLMLTIFQFCNFNKQNKFAIHLLMIQALFFLILRTFL